MTDYAFFLGCTIPLRYPHLEAATRAVCETLKIGLKEIEGASCCPEPVAIQSLGIETWLTLGARNLCLAEKMGLDILTVCSGCYETLKTVRVMLEREPKHKDEINKVLKGIGYEYKGTSKVYHLTELLVEEEMMQKIKAAVSVPLEGIRLASHPGCHLIRPSKILEFDDPERPELMDTIIKLLGAEAVKYTENVTCCGFCARLNEQIGDDLCELKFEDLEKNEIDAMITVCPACTNQYDIHERKINKDREEKLEIPVIHLPEIMALAFGINPKSENMDIMKRAIRPKKLLEKLNINV
jgi:heterodisulfide reductase subunit B